MDILRGERLSEFSNEAAEYTTSINSDKFLITPTIKINKAHMLMLVKKEIIDPREGFLCIKALEKIPEDIEMDLKLEDVHMNVEALVVKEIGEMVGGQLNLAKSRNDQVATAIRMTLREFILDISSALILLLKTILQKCDENLNTIMPGYTHLQHAQPVTLAHHLLAYYDSLMRDEERLMGVYEHINLSPMGACALATTGFEIDREMVSKLLGFDGLVENSIDAVSTRDFAVESISDLAIVMTDLSRFAEELIFWSSYEFSIVEVPEDYASTSSIMPQKKNPVVIELVRAKTSNIYGNLLASLTILKALPYSYNLDLQELTHHIWESCETTLSTIKIFSHMFKKMRFNTKRLIDLAQNEMSTATELADTIVREHRIPFRSAHRIVGILVRKALTDNKRLDQVAKEDLDEIIKMTIGKSLHTPNKAIQKAFDITENVKIRSVRGGPSSNEVSRMLKKRYEALKNYNWISKKKEKLKFADNMLAEEISKLKEVIDI